jgi:hypothetical protein
MKQPPITYLQNNYIYKICNNAYACKKNLTLQGLTFDTGTLL